MLEKRDSIDVQIGTSPPRGVFIRYYRYIYNNPHAQDSRTFACVYTYTINVCILLTMRANIYIRKGNEKAWDALPDKSQFINNALTGLPRDSKPSAPQVVRPRHVGNTPILDAAITGTRDDPKPVSGVCKHGAAVGNCRFGCTK